MGIVTKAFIGAIALCIAIQFIPYGRNHANPPLVREPAWDSPATRELAKKACFDCHSNETVWPWYANIAPISWLIAHDVYEGRGKLNFSDWRDGRQEGENPLKMRKEIDSGEMPPIQYRLAHPGAKLDPVGVKSLSEGLGATASRLKLH